ncbi:hypothetical protein Taro_048146, partial [Colocasia esculenta]|nr:hypothetical protein [Colocasia esculenta]
IGTARKAPFQNRHFDPVETRLHSDISGPVAKFLSRSVVAGFRCDRIRIPLRSNGHNIPLANELGITFRPDIGIADVTTIQNRHYETVDRALLLQNSVSGPKFTVERVY